MLATKAITIRQAQPKDLIYLVQMVTHLFELESDYPCNEVHISDGLTLLMCAPDKSAIFVADDGNHPVGMCTVQLLLSTAVGGNGALVEDVIVDGLYQGQGIGKRLLESAELWSRIRGARRMQLLVKKDNTKAQDFYRKQHWTPLSMQAWNKPLPSDAQTFPIFHDPKMIGDLL